MNERAVIADSSHDSKNLVLKYEEELSKLKDELRRVNRDITSSASFFRLEEEKRRVKLCSGRYTLLPSTVTLLRNAIVP